MLESISFPSDSREFGQENHLPIGSIIRAVCQAANSGPDLLYEVMLKLSLLVESTAPMYGLSIWTIANNQGVKLNWAEGLDDAELELGKQTVSQALSTVGSSPDIQAEDASVCFVLAAGTQGQSGAALYGRCVRPLSLHQARDLAAVVDVARLAHAHVSLIRATPAADGPRPSTVNASLPGMIFASRAMNDVARTVDRIKDSQ